jgi:hypothetical protein
MIKRGNLKRRVLALDIPHEKVGNINIWEHCDQPREKVETKDRKREYLKWRSMRNLIAYIHSGYNGRECARMFGMDPVTFIHSIHSTCDCIEVKDKSSDVYLTYLQITNEFSN